MTEDKPSSGKSRLLPFPQLKTAFMAITLIQFILLLITASAFDGGVSNRLCFQATLGYWLMVAWFVLRRWSGLTKVDAFLIRTGCFLWLIVAVVVEGIVKVLFFGGI